MRTSDGGERLFEKAQQHILEIIESKDYFGGERIPSERDLAETLGIHRMTVRKAIERLIAKGLLERRGTSGTYIPEPVIKRPIVGHAFSISISEVVRQCGGIPGSRLLFFEHRTAGPRMAERLSIRRGDPIIAMKRQRTISGMPFCVETTYLPGNRVPGLAAEDLIHDQSLYALLKERYNIEVGTNKRSLSASPVSAQDAEQLGLRKNELALIIRTVSVDTGGSPIEYLKSVNHPQRVIFTSDYASPNSSN
ncbi:MAG: GntR family transcriptional regulator [Rhodospirillales bacterium]|nr:GntR family transcriptional regulator [Rhodospirillales bacterium]